MTTIHLISIRLHLDEPWCVGAPERALSPNQLPCATDPFGAIMIPSSSIAGALRHHLDLLGAFDIVEMMGGEDDDGALRPSAIRVLGVEVELPAGRPVVRRSQTAIDAIRGAAAVTMLRSTDLAPAGTTVRVDLRVDGQSDWYDTALQWLTQWRPFIGRARTVGMGAARVTDVRHGRLDLAESEQLALWLAVGGPELVDHVATDSLPVPDHGATDDLSLFGAPVRWIGRDTILVNGEKEGSTRRPYRRDDQWTIEATSWKGLLRSRVGFVLRTLEMTACIESTGCDNADCALCRLFGSTTRRGGLRIRSSIVNSSRAPVARTHVAIDRFTGGSSDHLLYGEQDLPIEPNIELDLSWHDADEPTWLRPLVAAALLDIHDGYAAIGSKTTSGYGTLRLADDVAQRMSRLLSDTDWVADLDQWRREVMIDIKDSR